MKENHYPGETSDAADIGPGRSPVTIGRRDLLLGGSACLLSAATLGLRAEASERPAAAPPNLLSRLGIGFWSGSEWSDEPKPELPQQDWQSAPFRPDVMAAHRLPHDAPMLSAGSVQVTVHGLFGSGIGPKPEAIVLNAHFLPAERTSGQTFPFQAWMYANSAVPHISGSVRFTMPVDLVQGLVFSVVHRSAFLPQGLAQGHVEAAHKQVQECFFQLSPRRASRLPKLRRGVYFLAVCDAPAPFAPNWNAYQFRRVSLDGALSGRQLCKRTLHGIRPVDFDYLVLEIAPGAPDSAPSA